MKTFLSIPINKAYVDIFRNHIWYRYTGKEYPCDEDVNIQNLDRASAYMERVIDRIINKARGILPFNSILLVIVGMERAEQKNPLVIAVTLASLAFSSLILLTLFWVHWGKVDHYQKASDEFNATARIIWFRSYVLQIAIVASFIGVFGVIWLGLFDNSRANLSVASPPGIITSEQPPPPVLPQAGPREVAPIPTAPNSTK